MKKYINFSLILLLMLMFCLPSCSRKTGCPGENATTKTHFDGSYKVKKSKQHLFDKKTRKNN